MDKIIKVAVLNNEVETGLLETTLTERNIPHQIQSFHTAAYDGIFQTQMGWGAVFAPESFFEEILEIINDIRRDS